MKESAPEQVLVQRLRERRAGAFEELYRAHKDQLWRFLVRWTGPGRRALAEDLFQDTWVAAARNAHRLRADTALLPWLYTIARNKHRNSLRLLRHETLGRRQVEAPAPPALPDADAEWRAEALATARAFQQLAEAHREVLLLSAVEGLDASAIGLILGVQPEAVRKRLSRARSELKRLMTGQKGKP